MENKILLAVFFFTAIMISGCPENGVERIDTINDEGKEVLDLDYRDFELAAAEMARSMIESGALNKKGGGRYVVATSDIANITTQRINCDLLMAKIEEEIFNSGQAVVTSAVGNISAIDGMVHDIRDVRDSDYGEEFNDTTIVQKGQLIAPELSISGKIFQRIVPYNESAVYKQGQTTKYTGQVQAEYYFQLKLTELASGLRLWQKEVLIGKRGKITVVSYSETEE